MRFHYITRDEYRASRAMLLANLRAIEVVDLADVLRRERLQKRLVELRELVA
jgi:hypothetical protein